MRAYDAAYALNPGTDKQLAEYVDRLLHRAYDYSLEGRVEQTLEHVGRALDIEDRHGVRRKYMAEFGRDYVLSTLSRCKPATDYARPKARKQPAAPSPTPLLHPTAATTRWASFRKAT